MTKTPLQDLLRRFLIFRRLSLSLSFHPRLRTSLSRVWAWFRKPGAFDPASRRSKRSMLRTKEARQHARCRVYTCPRKKTTSTGPKTFVWQD